MAPYLRSFGFSVQAYPLLLLVAAWAGLVAIWALSGISIAAASRLRKAH